MSSILKALRRLEEERARKSHVAPEVAASLLRGDTRRQKSTTWIWLSVPSLVALILAAHFWLWRPVANTLPIAPLSLATAPLTSTSPAGRGGEVIIEEVIDQRRPVLLPTAARPVPAPALPPTRVNSAPQQREEAVPTPSAVGKPAAVVSEERQRPIVSAIAWQDDSSARMAVVDGLPVMTGESVDTVKVIEILPDRIHFEEEGVRFFVRVQSP